nr:RHS repeat-associated core domain-containing protein [Pseudoalteromonas sp. OOF1S-7]
MVVGYDKRGNLNALGINDASTYSYIQQHSYTFDALGNLTSRALTGETTPTTFGYDVLNRVTKVNGEERYGYDANGNLTRKDGWTQKYDKAGEPLHALYERVKGSQRETFSYVANGNQLSATVHLNGITHTRTLDYNARNKVTQISQNGEVINFAYDANNRRYKRTEGSKTIYYVGALEIVAEGTGGGEFANQTYIRRSINGDAVQTYHPNGQASLQWLFTDHQGSVVAITDYAGKFLKRFKYNVFGKQSEIVRPPSSDASYTDWSTATLGIFTRVPANNHSYTGHEPITLGGDNRIIHMNGRIYDADTGRFMQADPVVQAPSNLQNYNAYSYVLNNPLSYTDPSGYFFDKLTKVIGFATNGLIGAIVAHHTQRFIANSSTLSTLYVASASIASSAICGPCSIVATAYVSAQNTYYRTGDFGAAIKAGAVSGVSAAAFYAVGSAFEGVNTAFGSAGYFGKVAAHGLVGGTMSVIQGGKFGHGFAAAGFTQALAPAIGRIQPGVKHSPLRIAAAAIVGGTASKISGGKFANGAVTAAFSRGLNDELHFERQSSQQGSALGEVPGYDESGSNSWRASNDQAFIDATASYNHQYGYSPGDAEYVTPRMMKAWAMVESGGDREAFLSDPLQVNNPGDWVARKADLGLTLGQNMDPQTSAFAALEWLRYKGFVHNAVGQKVFYRGHSEALRRYNGNTSTAYRQTGGREMRDWYADRVINLQTGM